MYTKIEIRNQIRVKKRAMTKEEILEKSNKIWENLRNTKEFIHAEYLYMYVSVCISVYHMYAGAHRGQQVGRTLS